MSITPQQLAKAGTEHAEQAALFCWAATQTKVLPGIDIMHAIPNGGERNKAVAGKLKAEGVKSGVPDIFLPAPIGPWHGLYIELKRRGREREKNGGCSPVQVEYMDRLRFNGYCCFVCYGWEHAADIVRAYLRS